jgi:hypothetical protein
MDRLLTDPSHRRELGLRGYRAFQENWTAEAHLERYFALIEEIAANRADLSLNKLPSPDLKIPAARSHRDSQE